uniref:Uncharacterized protein n=1 Tax=Heterorhabditis bacteriophora TaxID=37862 RepID=A0A1I7XU52_HETBA
MEKESENTIREVKKSDQAQSELLICDTDPFPEPSTTESGAPRAEYIRLYIDHRDKSLDEATPLVDHDILIQIAANTASSFDRFSKPCQTTKRRLDRENDKNEGVLKRDVGSFVDVIHALPTPKKKRRKVVSINYI